MISQIYITLLMLDALYVAFGLARKKNMWLFVFLYWCILTAKNFADLIGTLK